MDDSYWLVVLVLAAPLAGALIAWGLSWCLEESIDTGDAERRTRDEECDEV